MTTSIFTTDIQSGAQGGLKDTTAGHIITTNAPGGVTMAPNTTTPRPVTVGPTTPVPTLGPILSRRFAVRSLIHIEQERQATYMVFIGTDALSHNLTVARQCPTGTGLVLFNACSECDDVIATDDYSSLSIPKMPLYPDQTMAIVDIVNRAKPEYKINMHMNHTIPLCLDKGFVRNRIVKRAASAPQSVLGNHDIFVGSIEKCQQQIQYATPEVYGCNNLTHTAVLNQHETPSDNNYECLKVREITCTLYNNRFKTFYPDKQQENIEACGYVNFDQMNIGIFTFCHSVITLRGAFDNFPVDHTISEHIIEILEAVCGKPIKNKVTGDKIWADQQTCQKPGITRLAVCKLEDAPTTPSNSVVRINYTTTGTTAFLLGAASLLIGQL